MYYDQFGNSIFLNLSKNYNYSRKLTSFSKKKKWIPKTIYAKKFLIRNLNRGNKYSRYISVIGHLHHGKSTFINALSASVHLINQKSLFKDFSDFFFLEKQRSLSLQSSVTTLLICNKRGKSCLLTLIDCPGHPEFFDQTLTGMKISDGSLIVIDVSEGVLLGTELSLRNSIIEGLPIVIILNAIDRLILEYGYSPKIIQKIIIKILDELNSILEECILKNNLISSRTLKFFNPIDNNVCFASFLQGWSFTLEQYAEIYISSQPSICLSIKDLSLKFWNHFYYEIRNKSIPINNIWNKRTMFADFILEPLYKLNFLIIGEPILHVQKFLEVELGFFGIKDHELTLNCQKLTLSCFVFFFGGCRQSKLIANHTGLVSSLIENIPYFQKSVNYKKNSFKEFNFLSCLGYIYKLCPIRNENQFLGLTRILKGLIEHKTNVSIVTEGHIYYSKESVRLTCEIEEIYLPIGRYNINISRASSGSIVFIKGIDHIVKKSAILFRSESRIKNVENFYFSFLKKLLENGLYSSLCISIEPIYSNQLKKLYISLRKSNKIYPTLSCEVNQSGKLTIIGTGELYLDCVIHDTRFVFENIDVKISNPFSIKKEAIDSDVMISETIFIKKMKIRLNKDYNLYNQINCYNTNEFFPNLKKNCSIHYWKKFKNALNSGFIVKHMEDRCQKNKSKANSIWSLGPDSISVPSCSLVGESNIKKIPNSFKKKINQGFKLAVEKGPVVFEPLHQITFQIEEEEKDYFFKNKKKYFPGDIRRSFHKIFLENKPVIYEPYYIFEVLFQSKFYLIITKSIQSRKGYILSSEFVFEKKIFIIRFNIPVIYSIGLEFEFNLLTNKNTICYLFFDNWKKKGIASK
nr:U5 small nuclear ribonucleoprotein 116 kDa subunit [Cryptomonas curvata]